MDKKMNLVITMMASFISILLMTLIGVVSYFGDKGVNLIEKIGDRASDNTMHIDVNEFRSKQKFQHINIRIDDIAEDVDGVETKLNQYIQKFPKR